MPRPAPGPVTLHLSFLSRDLHMDISPAYPSGSTRARVALFALLLLGVALGAWASAPVTLTDANDAAHPLTYSAGPFFVPNIAPPVIGDVTCDTAHPCDETTLTVNVSAATTAGKRIKVTMSWPLSTTDADYDLYVLQGSNPIVQSATAFDPEIVTFPAENGTYDLRVVEFDPQGQTFTVNVFLEPLPAPVPAATGPAARFQVH